MQEFVSEGFYGRIDQQDFGIAEPKQLKQASAIKDIDKPSLSFILKSVAQPVKCVIERVLQAQDKPQFVRAIQQFEPDDKQGQNRVK